MTVAELIAALEQVEDKSKTVLIEGCDCINDAAGVSTALLATSGEVLIEARLR